MQTWIKANIGKLIARITGAETDITALNSAVGMPYNAPLNLSTRVYNLEIAPGYSDDYTRTEKAVGKWIDGKTIYKYTTYSTDIPAGMSTLFAPGGGFKIDTLVKSEAIYSYRDSTHNIQFVGNVGNSLKLVQIYYDVNNKIAVAEFNNLYTYTDVYVTYWYTKVRDE